MVAVLSYFLFIIPFLLAPKTKFVKYHLNQGLIYWLHGLVLSFGASLIILLFYLVLYNSVDNEETQLLLMIIPIVIIGIILLIYAVYGWIGTFNAFMGYAKPLPKIGHRILIKWKS